jgi:hypothetical protein
MNSEMKRLPEVSLWKVTWWEPPDASTTYPHKTMHSGSKYWRGGTNHSAEVIASSLEVAIAAVRAENPTAVFMNVTKASGTGLFYLAEEQNNHE